MPGLAGFESLFSKPPFRAGLTGGELATEFVCDITADDVGESAFC